MRVAGNESRLCFTTASVAFAIVSMLGCNGADADSTIPWPVAANPACPHFAAFVAEAAQRFVIPSAWICAVIQTESSDDVRATLPRGAIGPMQILPETWTELRGRCHLGTDPYDARDNIMAGAIYLRELNARYGIPGFLAAYNAAPERWEDHLATGRPLPMETRGYLLRVARVIGGQLDNDLSVHAGIDKSLIEESLFPALSTRTRIEKASSPDVSSARPSNDTLAHHRTALPPQSAGLFVSLPSRDRSQ